MSTFWIIVICVFYIPAFIITDLPILFCKDKYTMDYIAMIFGLVPIYNIFTAICSIVCMREEWRNLANRLKRTNIKIEE